MELVKITPGYVKQVFDTDRQEWTSQEFVADDTVTYEFEGAEINSVSFEERVLVDQLYLPFDMVQPSAH